ARVPGLELLDCLRHQAEAKTGKASDAKMLLLARQKVLTEPLHLGELTEQLVNFSRQQLPFPRWYKTASDAFEEGKTKPLFRVLYKLARRRLADPKQLCSPADRAGLKNCVTDFDVAQLHGLRFPNL